VSVLVALLGLALLLQGVAFIALAQRAAAPDPRTRRRGRAGMLLAPLGLLLFSGGLVGALLPGFFG
jgi:hypothetical protein